MEISLEAAGSSNNFYDVIILIGEKTTVQLFCTCSAGSKGMMCKHRAALLENSPGSIFSNKKAFDDAVDLLTKFGAIEAHRKHQTVLAALENEANKIKKTQQQEKQAYIRLLEGAADKNSIFQSYNLKRLTSTEP